MTKYAPVCYCVQDTKTLSKHQSKGSLLKGKAPMNESEKRKAQKERGWLALTGEGESIGMS